MQMVTKLNNWIDAIFFKNVKIIRKLYYNPRAIIMIHVGFSPNHHLPTSHTNVRKSSYTLPHHNAIPPPTRLKQTSTPPPDVPSCYPNRVIWYIWIFFKGHALGRTNDIQTQFIYVLYNKYAIVLIFYFLFLLFAARRPSSSLTVWGKQQ